MIGKQHKAVTKVAEREATALASLSHLHGPAGPRKTVKDTYAAVYFDRYLENVVDWMSDSDL